VEEQNQLFVPFTQLNKIHAQGHGLGLSIVRRIVERLGGQVWVESEGTPGQGSVFSFTLPASIEASIECSSTEAVILNFSDFGCEIPDTGEPQPEVTQPVSAKVISRP
jgi:hypothetical protein